MISLDDVIGHKHVVSYLNSKVEKDNLPRVIILHGNPGLGKTSIAKILAVEINCAVKPDMRESLVNDVIVNRRSTACIKLFNMSSIDDDTIESVVSELNVGFSPTGRKVLILDEAHGISKSQQDALLVEMDPPPENVYIIMCTTDLGNIKNSLISRSVATMYLKNLSLNELKQLAKKIIAEKGLKFDIGEERFIHYLNIYTDRQARNVVNFLSNFEDNKLVKQEDLEAFIDVNITKKIIHLVKYLYSSMSGGINFLKDMRFDNNFCEALIEVSNVALGDNSYMLAREEVEVINRMFSDKSPTRLVRFTSQICGLETLERRRVISVFMRNCSEFEEMNVPDYNSSPSSNVEEIRNILSIQDEPTVASNVSPVDVPVAGGIEDLFRTAKKFE